jgi:hypothetical protein
MPRGRRSSPRIVALCTREGTALVFRVARKLDSPNAWRKHWTLGHRLMKWWLRAFTTALATNGGFESMARYQAEGQMPPVKFRMKVTVIRQAPSRRNFIRDDDDLRYTTKPLNDALKHAGLIKDDSRRWLNQPMPVQEVSSDRHYWTVVRVEPDTEAALDELVSDMPEDAAADLRTFLGGGR